MELIDALLVTLGMITYVCVFIGYFRTCAEYIESEWLGVVAAFWPIVFAIFCGLYYGFQQ